MASTQTAHTEKCTGIVQLNPIDKGYLVGLQTQLLDLYPDQISLPKLHITILHQNFPKLVGAGKTRGDKLLKQAYKEGKQNKVIPPVVSFGDVYIGERTEGAEAGRVSTYVVIPEADLCKATRDEILSEAGVIDILGHIVGTEEEDRVFHISLTNLTGNGGDSLKYPNLATDTKVEL
mgnify:CR=1 FL=1